MPALVTHYVFAKKVIRKLNKAGRSTGDVNTLLVGAQGPDIFFFHRLLPWHGRYDYVSIGRKMHNMSPARLFYVIRESMESIPPEDIAAVTGYVHGLLCHYALDRCVHPYVYWMQDRLQEFDPHYARGRRAQYHYRVESALDTLSLRRETGLLIRNFKLAAVLPGAGHENMMAVGRFYHTALKKLFGIAVPPESLAHLERDMRRVLRLINDPAAVRRRILLPMETLARRGHVVTSLLRPAETSDWDYANLCHAQWHNPSDPELTSDMDFFSLFDNAACEAVELINGFLSEQSMTKLTQDIGFYSGIQGVYLPAATKGEVLNEEDSQL